MTTYDVNVGTGNGSVGMAFYGVTGSVTAPDDISDIASTTAITTAGYTDMGELSSDGMTISNVGYRQTIRNWAGAARRTTYTDPGYEISIPMITSKENTLKAIFGTASSKGAVGVYTEAATATHGKVNTLHLDGKTTSGEQAFLLLAKDGDDQFMIEVPDGYCVCESDIVFAPGSEIKWPATIVTGQGGLTIIKDDGQVTTQGGNTSI